MGSGYPGGQYCAEYVLEGDQPIEFFVPLAAVTSLESTHETHILDSGLPNNVVSVTQS